MSIEGLPHDLDDMSLERSGGRPIGLQSSGVRIREPGRFIPYDSLGQTCRDVDYDVAGYPIELSTEPKGPSLGTDDHVVRGLSWVDHVEEEYSAPDSYSRPGLDLDSTLDGADSVIFNPSTGTTSYEFYAGANCARIKSILDDEY